MNMLSSLMIQELQQTAKWHQKLGEIYKKHAARDDSITFPLPHALELTTSQTPYCYCLIPCLGTNSLIFLEAALNASNRHLHKHH